jgi:exonuclease III
VPGLSLTQRWGETHRLATFNLAGFKAANKKGLRFYIEAEDPDFIVLTETKVQTEPDSPDALYLKQKYKVRSPRAIPLPFLSYWR